METYRGCLTAANAKFDQLTFKHRVLINSQFEMTKQMNGLIVIKGKLQKKIVKTKQHIGLNRTIQKCKTQVMIAISVGVIVSLINWLII